MIKVLECLHVLDRMMPILEEAGCSNQTAYRKKSSCTDALFATQEAIVRYTMHAEGIHACVCMIMTLPKSRIMLSIPFFSRGA